VIRLPNGNRNLPLMMFSKTSNSQPICERCRNQIDGLAVELRKFYRCKGETIYPDLPFPLGFTLSAGGRR